MPIVDQTLSARQIEARLAKTKDPRQRKMLETVHEHLLAEAAGSLDRLLATLTAEPKYHFWGSGVDNGPKGMDAIAAYYTALVEDKRGVLEFDLDRIVVDDDTIVTEGTIRAINRGSVARARGYEVDDEDGDYLVSMRALILWPFNEKGEMIGEDGYGGFDPKSARKLAAEELPEAYRELFAPA